ncbi:MAG: efflux RND transporter periplasmic adaptor subunit [Hyphomicrobiales bacterium]
MDRIIKKKKWTTKKVLLYSLGSIFLLFVLYLLFFRDKSSRLYVEKDYMSFAKVKKGDFQEFIPVDGIVFPKTTIFIDAISGGNVEKVYVEDGAVLMKGDTILKLVNANMELRFMEQETRIFDAINNLENTQLNLEKSKFHHLNDIEDLQYKIKTATAEFNRKKTLYDSKIIPDKEFEDAERDYRYNLKKMNIALELQRLDSITNSKRIGQLAISMKRMKTNLGMLKESLDNLFIKSPAQGKLSSFSAEIGESKTAGEHLGQIDLMDGFKIRANIDERYIARVSLGQEAEFRFSNQKYNLEISKIYTNVKDGAFQVDMKFSGDYPENIKRGQTLQLRLKFSSPQEAIMVKRGGFFQETGGNWIYVVDPSGEFAIKRNIRINRQNTEYYEVLEGLKDGEEVIVSSYSSFGDKDKLIFK